MSRQIAAGQEYGLGEYSMLFGENQNEISRGIA
jgi:hypothetical protein